MVTGVDSTDEFRRILTRKAEIFETFDGVPDYRTRFMLKYGHAFQPCAFAGRRGPPQNCFMNAYIAARDDQTLLYVEGYAINKAIGAPFQHAWVTAAANQKLAMDPTLTNVDNYLYFGVPLPRDKMNELMRASGQYDLLWKPDLLLLIEPSFEAEFTELESTAFAARMRYLKALEQNAQESST